ncbi:MULTISPECIES: hypothetical protein [unclassified Paraburkholderia]|uniref:hypothetical protein n=1 Tax=unclassified Paraburkholderia TaxID=2615204 RepID=UPI00160B5C7D|nr:MULTISPECIES: hypothetical protein [unclassified Paraburkholderia]MBB5443222.1 hypothetical protein [Paraburkholderia sp. WSM4177]MBB5483172.1 hypothetical protein [Paraburkholderia sp. WSM4180]
MRVRVVAAALAVWCVSEVALAAGYAEVWNPPEASGHIASGHVTRQAHARKKPEAVKVKAGAKGGVKTQTGAHARQTAGARHAATHVASAGAAHGGKLAAHGNGVKHLVAGGNVKDGVKVAASGQNRSHAIVDAQAAKPAQGKVVHADFAAAHTARPHVDKVAAKPAISRANPIKPSVRTSPDASANVSDIAPMGAVPNPATASSGSLPPIIH